MLFHGQEVIERDQAVFQLIYEKYQIPTAVLMSGGIRVSF